MKTTIAWGAKNAGAKFTVKANDLESACTFLESQGEWGHFRGDIQYTSKGDADGNVSSVVLQPTYTITMPSWPNLGKQPKTCKAEWERMYKALLKHEEGHRDRFLTGLKNLESKLKALDSGTHTDVDDLLNQALADIQAEHDSYDASTKNGGSQGVKLTIAEECESK